MDEQLKEKMGEEARKVCEREYTWDRHVEKVLKLSQSNPNKLKEEKSCFSW